MAEIPHFRLYGEEDPGVESRIQPKLPLRGWDDLTRDEKLIAQRELINNDCFLDDQSDQILDVILYLNHRFLRILPGKNLHDPGPLDETEAAYRDFSFVFLEERSDLVLIMLSKFASCWIDTSALEDAEKSRDIETRKEIVGWAFREFDRLARTLNHIFEQFSVNILVTRNGFVPRQDDKIAQEIYVPTLKALSDPKWKQVSDHLSDMFDDYQARNYPEVITKAHSALQRFLQILVGEGKNGKGELSKLFAHAKKESMISDNLFIQKIVQTIQSFISSERANNSTAKPSTTAASSSDALLVMNVLMVFLQHCLHNTGQMEQNAG